jgi:hypothetical protein
MDGNIRSQDVEGPIDNKQSDGGKETTKKEEEGICHPRCLYALHDVLRRMAIFMPTITLNDVEDKREVIEDMLEVLKPLLLTVSLQLNTDKSNVLIQEPFESGG